MVMNMSRTLLGIVGALGLAVLPGAARAAERPVTLLLFCGAGIRPAAEALIGAFEALHPEVRVSATYGGSGHLLGQIGAVRKGDVFMPGEAFYVDRAVAMGLAEAATRRTAGWFVPVIFTRPGNPRAIAKLADLAQPGLRLGVGDERSCAVGLKTVELLAQAGAAAAPIRANIVYKSGTVDELAVAVRLGTVDAVIVWEAVARHYARDGAIVPLAEGVKHAAEIPIVRLNSSGAPAAADAFIAFVAAPAGQALLAKLGYGPPPKTEPAMPQPEKREKNQ
jgi:molybdate transport system substrate-binding protein